MNLIGRMDGICSFYYCKSWRNLTKPQRRHVIELYKHWVQFARKSYTEDLNYIKKIRLSSPAHADRATFDEEKNENE